MDSKTFQLNTAASLEDTISDLESSLNSAEPSDPKRVKLLPLVTQLAEYLKYVDTKQPDWALQKSVISLLDLKDLDSLADQLQIVCVFLRTFGTAATTYSYVDCLEILAGTKTEFDRGSFLSTLREYKDDKYGHEIAWQASDPETWLLNLPENYTWFDTEVRTVLLHISFKWFFMMSEERQKNLLTSYFWQACQAGVPLRENIGELLYQTNSIAEYAIENQHLISLIDENKEQIEYGEGQTLGSFLDIAQAFYKTIANSENIEKQATAHVQSICPSELKDAMFPEQLSEALAVYTRLKEAVLIERNMAGEPEGRNQFNLELTQLVTWFANEADWNKLGDYFKNEQSLVSWKQFFMQYAENIDVQADSDAVSKLLSLNEFLQTSGLIPEDFTPISFHESDSQFHWNSELLS